MSANSSKFDGVELSASAKRAEDGYIFFFSSRQQIANNGGAGYWLVSSGNKTIIVTQRIVTTNGDELEYSPWVGSTITDEGTLINHSNLNAITPLKSTVVAHIAPTFSDKGIQGTKSYMPGASGQGQSDIGNVYSNEQENILPPHTTLLLEITNNGSKDDAECELYVSWAEVDDPSPFQA
jgi:hypothetical protein